MPGLWLSAAMILCCALLFTAGCTQQDGVKTNDTVKVLYTESFQDGTVFETNVNSTPLEITVGRGQVTPKLGLDEALIGMTPGMKKTVTISPEKGYGLYNASKVYRVSQDDVTAFLQDLQSQGNLFVFQYPEIGSGYSWTYPDGTFGSMQLTNITDTMVTVDLNNPLAGKSMVFDITLVEIVK